MYECVFDLLAAVQQRRVVIENNHGEKLSGILHETGSKQLVIVCHGFQSSKVIFLILSILFFSFYKNICISILSKQKYWLIFFDVFALRVQERIPMVNLAAALEKEGISAFRFDFAGNG